MLELAAAQTPQSVRRDYVDVYRELGAAGYTAVGEFHYLGFEEARAAAEAAAEAGIRLVLLLSAYGRGGLDRFPQGSVAEDLRQGAGPRGRGGPGGPPPPPPPALPPPPAPEDRR